MCYTKVINLYWGINIGFTTVDGVSILKGRKSLNIRGARCRGTGAGIIVSVPWIVISVSRAVYRAIKETVYIKGGTTPPINVSRSDHCNCCCRLNSAPTGSGRVGSDSLGADR
jgi:hypothetical protein